MYNAADMSRRRSHALAKVNRAIAEHGGTTLLSTGITADDSRLARAVVDAGVRLLEPNHPAMALGRGLHGVSDMHTAEKIRHEVAIDEVYRVVHGVRSVVGDDIFITVGIPGGFTELAPVDVPEDHFAGVALAGADGLHTHKSSLADLEAWVETAHRNGLLVDAYIARSSDRHPFGVPADTTAKVVEVARDMVKLGVDMIGLMSGMSYGGVAAGQISPEIDERLRALVGAVDVPTLAEGGVNAHNQQAFRDTGVSIIVVGTAFDDVARNAVAESASDFIPATAAGHVASDGRSSAPAVALGAN
jgi:hypothetical protein